MRKFSFFFSDLQQETVVREALLETFYLIGVTVHPSHLNGDYRLSMRDEMLGFVKVCRSRFNYYHYTII